MKNFLLILVLFTSLNVSSQNLKKAFGKILDLYITKEIVNKKFSKDDAIIILFIKKIDSEYVLGLQTFELKYYPNIDSLKIYKGVRISLIASKDVTKLLPTKLKPLTENREFIEEPLTIHESIANFTFQFNNKNEIYIISTSDDNFYYEKFKMYNLKIAKDLKFGKDLMNTYINNNLKN